MFRRDLDASLHSQCLGIAKTAILGETSENDVTVRSFTDMYVCLRWHVAVGFPVTSVHSGRCDLTMSLSGSELLRRFCFVLLPVP